MRQANLVLCIVSVTYWLVTLEEVTDFFVCLFFNHIVVVEGVKNTGKQLVPNNDHLQPIPNLFFSTEIHKTY